MRKKYLWEEGIKSVYPFVPHEETAEAIAKRIINVCHKRFPWIKIEDIKGILNKYM